MLTKKLILTSQAILFTVSCYSQLADTTYYEVKPSSIKLSYNSSLVYPGAHVGLEVPLSSNQIVKKLKSGGTKEFIRNRFISTNLSYYHHPNFHDNIYLTTGLTFRKEKKKGFFFDFLPEVGISRTFLGATTYKVDHLNNVSIEKHSGYYYALISIGGSFGYDFSIIYTKPYMAYCKFNILTMFPYNSTYYIRPVVEFGIIYKTKNLFRVNAKSRFSNKGKY